MEIVQPLPKNAEGNGAGGAWADPELPPLWGTAATAAGHGHSRFG